MIIRQVELLNYRNYGRSLFNLSPGINVFYGDNAQGKTNALEAIFMCATSKTQRGTKDKDVVYFGEQEAHIKLLAEKDSVPHRIDVHLRQSGRKGIAIDGIPVKRSADLFGFLHIISFAPDDLSIIKDAPAVRRNFIDMELCQLDRIYTYNLTNYNKAVIQKNKLLKQLDEDPMLADTLPMWNEQLLKFGLPIIAKRQEFISEINGIISEIHKDITDGNEKITLFYEPNCEENDFRAHLQQDSGREIAAHMALFGPHRDDIGFDINGIDVRQFGSQGQQRTAALSLKLSEIELVKRVSGDEPVLLLDDVLSELDGGRQRRLLSALSGVQTVITCTGLDEIPEGRLKIDKTFTIKNGCIESETN